VDEAALARALADGRVAGAALDVYATERARQPAFGLPNVVVTPHLGASTHEAQEKAGTQVARSVRLALAGEFVPDAVNVQGGVVDEMIRPGCPWRKKLGRISPDRGRHRGPDRRRGTRGDRRPGRQRAAARRAQGRVQRHRRGRGHHVNAPLLAADRGVEVEPGHR